MSRLFYHVMQDNFGNLLFNVTGTMRLAGTSTLATIYSDEALTAILPNPMTNHVSFGSFKCFLGPGDYDFYMAKGGYTFETLTGVQGYGTMADQDANAVAITGGALQNLTSVAINRIPVAGYDLSTLGKALVGTQLGIGAFPTTEALLVGGEARVTGKMAINAGIGGGAILSLDYPKAGQSGLAIRANDADSGPGGPVTFQNVASGVVGTITTTATTTAYNTSSDVRLKECIETLVGALDVIRALNPVSFRWQADGSKGNGFLAHELQQVVPEAVTGTRDAVDDAGQIVPQQMDASKLVPWLTAALQAVMAQVDGLQERVLSLETALAATP